MLALTLIILLLKVSLARIGFGAENINQNVKFQNNSKDDPNFPIIAKNIGSILEQHCNITLGDLIAGKYQVVTGFIYTNIFDTEFGPLRTVAQIGLKLDNFALLEIGFTQNRNTTELRQNPENASTIAFTAKRPSNETAKNDSKFAFPELKQYCDDYLKNKKSQESQPAVKEATKNLRTISEAANTVKTLSSQPKLKSTAQDLGSGAQNASPGSARL